jgi:hypothetical protein
VSGRSGLAGSAAALGNESYVISDALIERKAKDKPPPLVRKRNWCANT